MTHRLLPIAVLCLLAPAVHGQAKFEYDWLAAGNRTGHLVVDVHADGTRESDFRFNDRGRGPQLRERYRVDDDGTLSWLEVEGRAYLGARVDERFSFGDSGARWRSEKEEGTAQPAEPAFYIAADGTPEQVAALARALLHAPDRTLALLPSGRARIERVAEHDAGGRTAVLYAITGLDLEPQYVWLDDDHELFALAFGWMGLVPAGGAELLPALQAVQDAALRAHHEALAARLTHLRAGAWCIVNASVLDVDRGRVQRGASVRIDDGTITAVGDARCAGVPTVDAGGRTLLPGLWDMHGHLNASQGLLHVAAGVTAVRDMANDHDRLDAAVRAFDSGSVIGPRVFRAGFIDARSPYAAPTGRLADSLDDALAFVDWYAERDYPQIKIYSSIDPAWVRPLAERIHRHGMRLSGHIPSGMSAGAAVRAGFDEIQHVNMVFLNFLAGPDDDTRTPVRFTLVAERAHALDLDSAVVRDFIALLRERGTVVDPTVTIFEEMFRHPQGTVNPAFAMVADHLPPAVRRQLLGGGLPLTAENDARYRASFDALLAMIRRLHDAGVRIVPGTDTFPGFGLHRELELYARAGIPSAEVLRLATLGAAEVAGVGDRVGRIAPGFAAELVLVDGDPLADISAVRRAVLVVRGTRTYRPAELYEAVGIQPFVR